MQPFLRCTVWIISCGLAAACGQYAGDRGASVTVREQIIALERSALDRWITADPGGYLDLYAKDATYFDPMHDKRIDGLEALSTLVSSLRGASYPFKEPRYDMIEPTVQVHGDVAVLSFNLVQYGKLSGGQETVLARWNTTEVYRQINGAWRIIHTHWSFTKPELARPATS